MASDTLSPHGGVRTSWSILKAGNSCNGRVDASSNRTTAHRHRLLVEAHVTYRCIRMVKDRMPPTGGSPGERMGKVPDPESKVVIGLPPCSSKTGEPED